jgi:LysM repeat protein
MNKSYNYPLEGQHFRKPRRSNPRLIYAIAGILVLGGLALLVVWLSGPNRPLNALFATATPTPTITSTPTVTPTVTETPTITPTTTNTSSPTPSAPFNYTVQEGDSLAVIVERFNLGEDGIKLTLMLNPFNPDTGTGIDPTTQIVYPGLILLLPYPGMPLPTSTPVPPNLPRGTKIDYIIEPGDTLAGIASTFNSTEEEIIKENNIEDPNAIQVGQLIVIPVNLVTPTATRPPTSTPVTPGAVTTPLPSATATPTVTG